MVAILVPGQAGSVDDISVSQGGFREQVGAIALAVKRLVGSGDFAISTTSLYVNPEIGNDRFVIGNAAGTPTVSNQQLTCGYSVTTPFRTIQRALVEAYRLSIRPGVGNDYYDRVLIRVSTGEHLIYNGAGSAAAAAWADGSTPTVAQLQALNPVGGGVVLPRGVSIIGDDLRKTVIRPMFVPTAGGNPSTGRAAIFKATGGSFFFNFTFKDATAVKTSHHLLSAFAFCPTADLQAAYDLWDTTLGLAQGDSEVMPGETELVAPYPDGQAQPAVDTTVGASAYIFNCSLRSDYGMCGIYLDGDLVEGFKSMVVAQFTNVSLQKDMQAWQIYSGSAWAVPASYAAYIASNVNDVRARVSGNYNVVTGCYDVDYRSFAFKAINNAILQEVSCFVIGDAIHHWTSSGGELTITNSNSNFGMTALLSSGFRGVGTGGGAFPQDAGWQGVAVRRPLQIKQDGSNIREISLGTVAAYDKTTGKLTLNGPIDKSRLGNYTLKQGDYIWVENRRQDTGPGYTGTVATSVAVNARAELAATPWVESAPTIINLNPSTSLPVNNIATIDPTILLGNRVYIRRLIDTRTPEERIYTVEVQNSNLSRSRRPPGNFIVRLGNRTAVADQLDPSNSTDQLFIVTDITAAGSAATAQGEQRFRVTLRSGDSAKAYQAGEFYRFGVPALYNNRIYRSKRVKAQAVFQAEEWEPSLSMMPNIRGIEYPRSQIGGEIIVDADLSNDPDSKTLGINLTVNAQVLEQVRSATDYQAVAAFMEAVGYQPTDIAVVLAPQATELQRPWDPSNAASAAPAGKLKARAPWPLEFNRPSLVRAFGHAYEWAGQGNYSKAMPKYQVTSLSDQHKVDFFAVSHLGGRVYNTGFNEDGLLIQGDTIRDLGTGRELSIDIAGLGGLAGDPDIPITVIPNSYDTLTVIKNFQSLGSAGINDLTLNGLINGSPVWAPGALPLGTATVEGILRLATAQETAELAISNAAITPGGLGQLANVANGWAKLDAAALVPLPLLPDVTDKVAKASTTVAGIVELATNAEGLGLADAERAVTAAVLGYIRSRANGLAALDAAGLLPVAQLPDIPVAKLPGATITAAGVSRLATDAETAAFTIRTGVITPGALGTLLNKANGLVQLDGSGKIPATLFPDVTGAVGAATTTQRGIIELATDAEGLTGTDGERAVTPSVLGYVRGRAGGFASLDGGTLVPVAQLPAIPISKLPVASTTAAGISRYVTPAEALGFTVADAALTPFALANVLNKANGLLQLSAGNVIPTAYLTAATDAVQGVVELAVNPATDALTDNQRAVVPAYINALRGAINGLAELDAASKIPISRIPAIPLSSLRIAPRAWTSGSDNLILSTNFNYTHTGTGTALLLGAVVNIANYLGQSGFISITNGTAAVLSSVNDPMWKPVFNTWVDPQAATVGLAGNLLLGYYVASATQVIYDITKVS